MVGRSGHSTSPRGGSFCPLFPVRIGIRMIVLMEGGKAEDPEKNPRSKGENQQQTRPTCHTRSENRTRAGWLEASALTTASNIFPNNNDNDTNNNDGDNDKNDNDNNDENNNNH